MYFKLSNTAKREIVEQEFGLTLKYPELYSANLVINGLDEDNINIVTAQNPKVLDIAIWGILPQDYDDDWVTFQNTINTLNISLEMILESPWLRECLKYRRCLVLVTGFFTYVLRNGTLYPYHMSLQTGEAFYLAGIYNQLKDGFLSSGLITTQMDKSVSRFYDLSHQMPMVIPESIACEWLSPDMEEHHITGIIKNPPPMKFRANPIAKEFFKNNIVYESMLQPVYYDDINNGEND